MLFVPLSVDSMSITMLVQLLPRETDGQRWLSLRVRAQNPRPSAIVAIPYGSQFGFGVNVRGYNVGGYSLSKAIFDSSSLYVAALEIKEWLFKFRVDNQHTLYTIPPDAYLAGGGFGQHWTNFTQVTVVR